MADEVEVWDSGTGDEVVTITAPVHTLNWALLGAVVLGVWWFVSSVYTDEDDYEDG